ncbi:hypothetical protein HC931_21365 [Candidatus Gracilibacteria bacterium]|nr:hypothetical protein [Candidatus Gracilibacteria bacterium]
MRGNGNEALGYLIVVFFLIWLVVKIAIWSIKIILIVLAIAIGLAIIALIPGLIIWLFIQVFKQMRQQEFERVRAILLPILTILMGISIGFCIQLDLVISGRSQEFFPVVYR